jgi:hypothetical protein
MDLNANIVIAFDQSNTVKIVGIGTVTKEVARSLGETIFLPQGHNGMFLLAS